MKICSPEYYKKYKGERNVPKNALLEWAEVNDLDNIREPVHKKEREFYENILFHLEEQGTDFRRDTFAFVMECIKECTNTNTLFNEDVLRNIHYYSSYLDGNGEVCPFVVPEHFNNVYFYWSVYEGHVYFRWWLSKYFEVFLNYLKSCDNGSTIDEFFAEIAPDDFNATVKIFCKENNDFFNEPIETLLNLFSASPPNLSDGISEEAITNDKNYETKSEVLAKFVLVLAGLYVKFERVRSDIRFQELVNNLGDALWFETLFRFGNLKKMSVRDFLKTVLKRYIIDQHDLVMIEKNDLRRCWFTTENQRYFHQADVSLIWRPAKYQTIMNFLSDMNLIDNDAGMVSLSNEGTAFFNELNERYY